MSGCGTRKGQSHDAIRIWKYTTLVLNYRIVYLNLFHKGSSMACTLLVVWYRDTMSDSLLV